MSDEINKNVRRIISTDSTTRQLKLGTSQIPWDWIIIGIIVIIVIVIIAFVSWFATRRQTSPTRLIPLQRPSESTSISSISRLNRPVTNVSRQDLPNNVSFAQPLESFQANNQTTEPLIDQSDSEEFPNNGEESVENFHDNQLEISPNIDRNALIGLDNQPQLNSQVVLISHQPTIYKWNYMSQAGNQLDPVVEVPSDHYVSFFANYPNNSINRNPEFWLLGNSGILYHYNPIQHRWKIVISPQDKSSWNTGHGMFQIKKVVALTVANSGQAKGRVIVALELKDQLESILAEVGLDSSTKSGYTLTSRTKNGKIYYRNHSNQLVPVQVNQISLSGDDHLIVLGSSVNEQSRESFVQSPMGDGTNNLFEQHLFTPISKDLYQLEVPKMNQNDLIGSSSSNFIYTSTNYRRHRTTLYHQTHLGSKAIFPTHPPFGNLDWSIQSFNFSEDGSFPVLVINQDPIPAGSNLARAHLYNIIDLSTGSSMHLSGNFPAGSLVATTKNEIFIYLPVCI